MSSCFTSNTGKRIERPAAVQADRPCPACLKMVCMATQKAAASPTVIRYLTCSQPMAASRCMRGLEGALCPANPLLAACNVAALHYALLSHTTVHSSTCSCCLTLALLSCVQMKCVQHAKLTDPQLKPVWQQACRLIQVCAAAQVRQSTHTVVFTILAHQRVAQDALRRHSVHLAILPLPLLLPYLSFGLPELVEAATV